MINVNYPAFIDHPTAYEKARYVVQPITYDREGKGTFEGASAVLRASHQVEDYDIETDSQPYKKGIHTAEVFVGDNHPERMIQGLRPIAEKLFKDGKVPCFLGGDHAISIAVFEALRKMPVDVTILQLGARANLRPSYNGSTCDDACVIYKAKELFPNVVQCGIRSMSFRERGAFDPDKTFFAADIHASTLWIDDLLDEVGRNVYITLDASVFDPSIMNSHAPLPDGLSYAQVLKLLKAVHKERNVLGIDIVGFCPNLANRAPEYLLAKLIYQWMSF